MTTAIMGAPRSNRIVSRLSHLRDKETKKKDESVEIKFDLDNLPSVDRAKGTGQQKKRIHQIILNKDTINREKK
jgi:DNA modification methylase